MRKLLIAFALLLVACNISLQERTEKTVKKHLTDYSKKELVNYKPLEFSPIDSCWSCIYEDEKLLDLYTKQVIFNDAFVNLLDKAAELQIEYKEIELYALFNKSEARRRLNKFNKNKKEFIEKIHYNTDSLLYYLTSIRNCCDTFQSEFIGYKINHKLLIDTDTITKAFIVNGDSVKPFTSIETYKEIYNNENFEMAVEGGILYEELIEALKKFKTLE